MASSAEQGRHSSAPSSHESLRAEARRRNVGVYQVRLERGRSEARARGEEVPTAREALGHRRPGQSRPTVHITALLADPARASVVEVDIPTARRIGKHDELARRMVSGDEYRGRPLTPERFRRLVGSWQPVTVLGGDEQPGRYQLLTDPGAVIALLDAQRRKDEGVPAFHYERAPR